MRHETALADRIMACKARFMASVTPEEINALYYELAGLRAVEVYAATLPIFNRARNLRAFEQGVQDGLSLCRLDTTDQNEKEADHAADGTADPSGGRPRVD